MELGLTPRRAVLLIYGITSIFAIISLLTATEFRYSGLVIILFAVVSWIGIQHLGYAEFTEARKIILSGTVRQLIASQSKLRSYRYALEQAESLHECWELTVEAMRELGFDHVELFLPGVLRSEAWLRQPHENPGFGDCWSLRIPLGTPVEEGWLQLSRRIDRGEGYLMLHAVVETVRDIFPGKILEQEQPAPGVSSSSLIRG